jgi:glycosyltransferase involved in cell wall biosynthesis
VVPLKGHDVLVDALTGIAAIPWHCTLVGPLERDPPFVERLRRQIALAGLTDRIRFAGPRRRDDLRRDYRSADVVVAASRFETYGMVVTEALAVGLPVIATAVGGTPEALGGTDDGPPGLLVAPGDSAALGAALADWLRNPDLRRRLQQGARARRETLEAWSETARRVAAGLAVAGDEPVPPGVRVLV